MREIKFRGKSRLTGKWMYGNLIIKKEKTSVQPLDSEMFSYKYLIQYRNKNGRYSSCEVDGLTVGQFIGHGEYGDIYEGMELYDEYAEENCTVEYDKEDCGFRLCYSNYTERIQDLSGLRIIGG